ncbi:MAG: DNA alkylation repair protein [Nitrososphaerota archaeon]|jgi:3-methyladenine DNA glycosylase AlkD|nr:DNA alkylation repair protein [Nitrososphaerota archaeon]
MEPSKDPYQMVFPTFYLAADSAQAAKMSAYMRNLFPFLGIPTQKRKELSKDFLTFTKKQTTINWTFVNTCWEKEREFQYLALSYLNTLIKLLTPNDISQLKHLTTTKSWWDTIDCLDKIFGTIALQFPIVNDILLAWSVDENFWLRRIAIDHQLARKEKTNVELFEQILLNNLGHKEFFVNKAIGWSLREYSKTNPKWVHNFLTKYHNQLNPLSIKEASKYISK